MDACPNDAALTAFERGTLAPPRLDVIADHIEGCPECERRLADMERLADPLLDALKLCREPAQRLFPFPHPPHRTDELGRLAHYRVLKLLREGQMALTFEAEDTRRGRRVALEVPRPDLVADPRQRLRFLRASRAMAEVPDLGGPACHAGLDRDVPFLAIDLPDD